MSLADELLSQIHKLLTKNHYPNDADFTRQITEAVEKLILQGTLTAPRLAASIRLPSAYRRAGVVKQTFSQQIADGLLPLVPSYRKEISGQIHDFMKQLKYYLRRHRARSIFRRGKPLEEPGKHAVRDALFGFFRNEGLTFEEIPSGRGRIDVLVARGLLQIIVETKLSENFNGIQQLESYIEDDPERRVGYFFVFDTTRQNRFKSLCDVNSSTYTRLKSVYTLVVHVNLPIPSRRKK